MRIGFLFPASTCFSKCRRHYSRPQVRPILFDLINSGSDPQDAVRRQSHSVQSQSKPVYPSYHLETTIPISNKPRPTDNYKPLNILRSSPRPITIRFPDYQENMQVSKPLEMPRLPRGKEEFIAVVFGNEVWMGLVDFKSDKPQFEEQPEDEFGL
jgi:hypothetical protein